MADPCDIPVIELTTPCVAIKTGQAVGAVIDFATDPLGYIAQKMQEAAAGLSDTVLPQLEKLTHPDLSTDWFISAYRVSFALSLFVWVAFLGWNFVQMARRRVSGDEVAETMGVYTPLFLGGVMFGPLFGTMLLTLTGAITDALIKWGVAGSVNGTTKALQDAIAAGDQDKIVGGAIVAIIFFGCLIVALLLAFLVLLIMLVTLYLTGAIIPLSLVWLTHPRQRSKGLKVVMVWIGVSFSHVLLFLLLGVAFRMIGGLATNFDEGMTILANLAAATIALLMATLSPLGLLAFAPVGPSSAGGGGPSIDVPSQRGAGGGYPAADGDSQTAQLARDNDSYGDDGGGDPVAAEGGGGDGGVEAGGDSGGGAGGLLGLLAASRGGGSSSSSMEPAGTGGAEASAGGGDDSDGADSATGGSSAGDSSTAGAAQPGADTSSSGLAVSGTSAADGTAGMAAGSDSAEQAGDKLTAAGTAAEATGVGAPVGAAMQAAGQGLKSAGAATAKTAELAQSAGDMAAEHMEHGDTHANGGTGADTRPRR